MNTYYEYNFYEYNSYEYILFSLGHRACSNTPWLVSKEKLFPEWLKPSPVLTVHSLQSCALPLRLIGSGGPVSFVPGPFPGFGVPVT